MIKHIKCNIFESDADVILHQVNCQGVMGSGIAKQVKERYPEVYYAYARACSMYRNKKDLLCLAQYIPVENNSKTIVNLFAQENYGHSGQCYTDYDSLRGCLNDVREYCYGKTIAIPYLMGCYRGGGDWNIVYPMIEETLGDCNVLICEYNGG